MWHLLILFLSRFIRGIVDSMNAEIALGTVANANEGVKWLGYTYLFVRMRKNPFQYGMLLALCLRRRGLLVDDLVL